MKNKILIPLLALMCLLATSATAQVNYAVSGSAAYVTNSPNASGDIVIASTYNGYPVTTIGDGAFYSCTNLTSATIPNSVTNIAISAFDHCASLASVTIPDSVTSIGDLAFYDCYGMTSVTIGNSLTSIGPWTFVGCITLTNFSVSAANSVYSSLDGVFFNKARTTLIQFPGGRGGSYAIPNSVTSIEDHAFSGCTNLTNVTIPDSVTTIGVNAFSYCYSLTSATIGNSVTSISDLAFDYCFSLTNVIIPNSVTSIGNGAFEDCTSLTSVTIGSSVTNIGDRAFSFCFSLKGVTIPNSATRIGNNAFEACTSLTSVTIPTSITSIGSYAFSSCTSLTNLTFLGNAPSGDMSMFSSIAPTAKVYYYYGSTGWGQTYGLVPTVMLGAPAPQVGAGSAGVKAGGFGFTFNGVTNQTIVVEASTNLVNWQPISTSTLSTLSTNFVDPDWVNHPHRFYRLRSN